MELKYLKYGSLITLSTSEGFYLYSEGFNDSSPYLREQSKNFSEFSGAVFRLIPQCMHSVQTSILQYIKDIREADFFQKINHLIKMEENLEGEIKTNIHSFESLKGQVVKYNSLVQLEHLRSHKFLTLNSSVSAEAEKDNFKITLEDFPSDYSHFRIVPSYKFQKHGSGGIKVFDKVYLEILIPELRKVAFMHGSKGHYIDIMMNSIKDYTDYSQENTIGTQSNEQKLKAIEVNVSLDQKTRWSIDVYGDIQKENKHLACGDYIWLTMPEENVILTVYKKRWEVDKYKLLFSTNVHDRNGLWMIEYEDSFQGGPITEFKKYRLKHIITGMYLAIKTTPYLKRKPTGKTLWRFQCLNTSDLIKSDEICYIVHDRTGKTIYFKDNCNNLYLTQDLREICIYKPTKANNEIVWEILFLLNCYPILIKFPRQIAYQSSLCCQNDAKSVQKFRKYCEIVLKSIKNLKFFCKNKLQSMIGIDNQFGEVQYVRQLMLKQQNFFEAFAKILESVLEPSQYDKVKEILTKKDKDYRLNKIETDIDSIRVKNIAKIVKKIYNLLITMCDKNNETQRHAYKFFGVFLRHIGLNLGASKLMLSILRNNEDLMLTVHDRQDIDIVKQYSSMLLKYKNDKNTEFLDFLKSICAYRGEGVTMNQEKIFASIFKEKKIVKNALISTETEGNSLYIHIGPMKISLLSCFEGGRIIGYDTEIKYFTSLLELYSNLCLGRNFESSALLIPKFPLEVMQSMVWNSDLTIPIRAAFCKLMLTMYIDCFIGEELIKPNLIRIIKIDKIQDLTFAPTVKLEQRKSNLLIEDYHLRAFQDSSSNLIELQDRIYEYFEMNLKSFDNVFTYEVLEVVNKLIKFGVYGAESNYSDTESEVVEKELGIVRIIKAIVPILLNVKSSLSVYSFNSIRKRSFRLDSRNSKSDIFFNRSDNPSTEESSNDFKINHSQYLSSILKDSNSLNDPVIRSAANLKNFLNTYKQNPFNRGNKKLIEHKIKLKICKIIDYYLDTRQDFLITNVIEWFNQQEPSNTWKESDLVNLLPSILPQAYHKLHDQSNVHLTSSKFCCYSEPFLPDINSLLSTPIIPALLRSFIYSNNYKLQTMLISIILRSFRQRKEMLKNIKRLHIMFKPQDISLLKSLKSSLITFKQHSEQSEIWMNYWNLDKSLHAKHKVMFIKVKQILNDIQNSMYEGHDSGDLAYENISKSRQEMLFYLNVHSLIVSFVKDGMHKLVSIHSSGRQEELNEPCWLLTELFQICFKVLRQFVYNNPRNQKKMHKYMHILLQYLDLQLGQISLICEIYKNNTDLINTIDEHILKHFEDLIIKHGRQKEFLTIFEIIPTSNGKTNPNMQRLVLSFFVKEKLNTYMLYMDDQDTPQFCFEPGEKKNSMYKDEPFKYHSCIFNILGKCGRGITGMSLNEIKCQNVINLKNIFSILFLCENNDSEYKIMKISLLNFFYDVYLDCEILNLDLKSCAEFFDYIYYNCENTDQITDIDQDFINFLQLWIKILSKYRSSYIKKIDSSYYEQDDIKAIRAYSECLSRNAHKLEGKISKVLIEDIQDLCKLFNEEFEISHDPDIYNSIAEPQTPSMFSKLPFSNIKSLDTELWEQVKEMFIYNKIFKEKIEEEEHSLVELLYNSNKYLEDINFEKILRSLISYIKITRSQKPPLSVQILVIEFLEAVVSKPIADKFDEGQDAKYYWQNELNFYGLGNVVLTLMMDPQTEITVFKSLISLSIYLLDGGNFEIQNEFYQYFLSTSNSEYLFERISSIFQNKSDKIHEKGLRKIQRAKVYKEKQYFLKKVLRFLQLLCENHNLSLQNYIRFQEKSNISYNLITSVISLLDLLMKKKSFYSFFIMSQCFETLTEFIQGPCTENQDAVVNSKFIDLCSELLSLDENLDDTQLYKNLASNYVQTDETSLTHSLFFDEDEDLKLAGWMIAHLKFKCLLTLLSLFEGRKDNFIVTRLIRSLNLDILKENLKNIYINLFDYLNTHNYNWNLFSHTSENEKYDYGSDTNPQDENVDNYYSLVIENGFLVFHLLKTLQDSDDPENQETLSLELPALLAIEETLESFDTFKIPKNVDYKIREAIMNLKFEGKEPGKDSELITKVAYMFFKKHTGNIEVVFGGEIFRVYFFYPPEYQGLTKEIKENFHRNALRESDQSKLKYMLDKTPDIIEQINHEFVIKNIIKKSTVFYIIASHVEIWRIIAFLLTIVLNYIILGSYSETINDESFLQFNPDDKGIGHNTTIALLKFFGILQLCCCLILVAFFLIKVGPLLARKGWKSKSPSKAFLKSNPNIIKRIALKTTQVCFTIIYVLGNLDVIYYLLYTLFSMLGVFIHPFYYSLLLLDMIYRYPSLQNVVKSILLPRKALVLTFFLLAVIIYIFSILGYWLFFDYFNPDCKSLLQCFLTVWDKSFKSDGGIGGYLKTPVTPTYDSRRFFYDNIFVIVVCIVLMGVVQGIIIDTFARLREEQDSSKKDRERKCFICGLQKDYIEKKTTKGFSYHIENDHNEWNYILFLAYLLKKDQTEYTGIESFVRDQFDQDELSWIPNQSALSIRDTNKNQLLSKIKLIDSQLLSIEDNLKAYKQ